MNFDKLPSDIKRLIFDMNRETAKKDAQKRNHAMVQVELNMLFSDKDFTWHKVKPHFLREGGWMWKDKCFNAQLDLYYRFANRKILPVDKFVAKYIGLFGIESQKRVCALVNKWVNEDKPTSEPWCLAKGHCSMGWEYDYWHGDMSYENYTNKRRTTLTHH